MFKLQGLWFVGSWLMGSFGIFLPCLLLTLGAHAAFSTGCALVGKRLGLNLTGFWMLSRKQIRHKFGDIASQKLLNIGAKKVSKLSSRLLPRACPCAVVVSSTWEIQQWGATLDKIPFTQSDKENIWHAIRWEEKRLQEALSQCNFDAQHGWPVKGAVQIYRQTMKRLTKNLDDEKAFYTDWGSEITVTDDSHTQALADAKTVFEELQLEWWPSRGTLIALLRHGKRSGLLSNGKVDAVDHDVDVMLALPSLQDWPSIRASIHKKLVERGWHSCIGRRSTRETYWAWANAHDDVLMCARRNPTITLDIFTYITDGPVVYAQKYCIPRERGSGCWFPHDGTFHRGHGKLRVSAIRPLGQCKAGSLSVPCPRKPLEALKASAALFTNISCVALPDVADRIQYDSDHHARNSWLAEGLKQEDVDVLRARAAQLRREGYMSMAPYIENCWRAQSPR